jgi:hypothetical protein
VLEKGSEKREGLAINVVDDRGGEEDATDPPAEVGNGAAPAGITGLRTGVRAMLHQEATESEERWATICQAEAVSAESVAGASKADDCRSR